MVANMENVQAVAGQSNKFQFAWPAVQDDSKFIHQALEVRGITVRYSELSSDVQGLILRAAQELKTNLILHCPICLSICKGTGQGLVYRPCSQECAEEFALTSSVAASEPDMEMERR